MRLVLKHPESQYPIQLLKLLREIGYKSCSGLEVSRGTGDIFVVRPFIFVIAVDTKKELELYGPAIICAPNDTTPSIIRRVFKSLEAIEIHECAEQFTFGGTRIYDPHVRRGAKEPDPEDYYQKEL